MLKEHNVKQNVMKLHCEDLNVIRYLTQHGCNKNLDSHNQLIKNLVEGKVITLEHMDNKEQLTVMFKNQTENISSGIGTCTIEEL